MISLEVNAVGIIRDIGDGRSMIEVLPAYRTGLDGLVPGTRVQVLYWMHERIRSAKK